MSKNNQLKIMLTAILALSFVPCVWSTGNEEYSAHRAMKGIEQKIVTALQDTNAAQNGFKTVKTYWQVVPVKVFRKRKVSVNIARGKAETVQTTCAAIENNRKIYVIKSCYYPTEKENQESRWLGSHLLSEQGQIRLENPKSVREDWVVFDLPTQSQI